MHKSKRGFRPGFFAFGAHKTLARVRGGLTVLNEKLHSSRLVALDTGAVGSYHPNFLVGLDVITRTCADGGTDDVTPGKLTVATGNTVEAIIDDIGTATVHRMTGVINRSGGVLLVTVADETNTKINEKGLRLSITDGGYVALIENANDKFRVLDASGVTLVAFA